VANSLSMHTGLMTWAQQQDITTLSVKSNQLQIYKLSMTGP